MSKNKKMRKKGAIIIEFLVVLPVFMMLIWGIMQAMLFVMASSTTHEAAMEGARIIAQDMRGMDGGFGKLTSDQQTQLKDKLYNKIYTVTQFNTFILLFNSENGDACSTGTLSACPEIILKSNLDDTCTSSIQASTEKRIICATVIQDSAGGRDHEIVLVDVRAKFRVVGSFIPGLSTMLIDARGTAQKELTDRFQYYEAPCRSYGASGC